MQKWFHVHINFLSTRLLKAVIEPFHGPQRVDIEEEPISRERNRIAGENQSYT
jgi:hypothetical protein